MLHQTHENQAHENETPKKTESGTFIGECNTACGEKVYLHMEPLTNKNSKAWHTYKLFSERVAGHNNSILSALPYLISQHTAEDGSVYYRCNFKNETHKTTVMQQCGYSEQEFDAFIQKLGQRGFHATGKNRDVLEDNDPECTQWYKYNRMLSGKYIIFASTTTEFDITSIPMTVAADFTAKKYEALYRGLLMTVGADFSGLMCVELRGIYRNSYSVIEGTYKDISMGIFGFAGATALTFFKAKELAVRPKESIYQRLIMALSNDEYTIRNAQGNDEPIIEINLNALNKIYKHFPNIRLFKPAADHAPKVVLSREALAKEMGFDL